MPNIIPAHSFLKGERGEGRGGGAIFPAVVWQLQVRGSVAVFPVKFLAAYEEECS